MLADWHFNMKWFNHKQIQKKFLDLVVAVYDEDGSCFNIPDIEFKKDWERNIRQFFPVSAVYIHRKARSKYLGKIARKFLEING